MKVVYKFRAKMGVNGLPTFLLIESSRYMTGNFWVGGAYII